MVRSPKYFQHWKILSVTSCEMCNYNIFSVLLQTVGRDSIVDIATRYGLDGSGFEPRRRRDFPQRPERLWGPRSLLYSEYRDFPGNEVTGVWRWPPTPSSSEVKERIQYTSVPSWHVIGWNLLLQPNSKDIKFLRHVEWIYNFVEKFNRVVGSKQARLNHEAKKGSWMWKIALRVCVHEVEDGLVFVT
jgi:hypothetical protein